MIAEGNERGMEGVVLSFGAVRSRLDAVESLGKATSISRWSVLVAVAVVVAGCGSPSYGDLDVGDCVSGYPQMEDMYNAIDCGEVSLATEGEPYYVVVGKAPESDPNFSCSPFSRWITDGEWQLCFERKK